LPGPLVSDPTRQGGGLVIELYTYQTPNGQKASVMLEEVGLAYVVRSVDLMKGAQREPEFLRISPNNKIPAIVDDGGPEGRTTIFESGAILVYLAEKTGRLLPPSGPRSSTVSPAWATSWKNGETSPSARRSIASSITLESLGAEAIE
jgi:GST-like protein